MGTVPVTTFYSLAKPPSGEQGWTDQMNGNLDTIDSTMHALAQGGTTGPQGVQGVAGAVGLIWTGPWSNAVNYVATDAVSFNGSSYIARSNNTNTQPDTNPNTWAPLALMGQPGPQGTTGPPGPSGNAIAFPVTLAQGGTGAEDAPTARTNLGAAMSGQNTDITALLNLVTTTNRGAGAIQITSPGGSGNAILLNNGTSSGGFTSDAVGYLESLNVAGGVLCGALQCSSTLLVNQIGNASPGAPVNIAALLQAVLGVIFGGSTPTVSAGQVGIGGTTLAGVPLTGNSTGCLQVNIGGTNYKIPYI